MAADRPILNPTLRLTLDPTPVAGKGGGKSRASIKMARLKAQRLSLSEQILTIGEDDKRIARSEGRTLVAARMFADSLAPSHTPNDLFSIEDCRFVAPLPSGYLIDVSDAALKRISRAAANSENVKVMSDISRIKSVKAFDKKAVLRGQTSESLWAKGLQREDGARLFNAWLMPFGVDKAREGLLVKFLKLADDEDVAPAREMLPTSNTFASTSIGAAVRDYRANSGVGRAVVSLSSQEALAKLVASGTVFRLDPVREITVASAPTSKGTALIPSGKGPVVACIDGGMTDPNYRVAEAWRVAALVDDADADSKHGNAIGSLIAHAAELNPNLNLPDLQCQVGIAQAVPHERASKAYLPDDLFDLLSLVAVRHRDTRVWNMSFNLRDFDDDPDLMSDFGHQISVIARAAGVLPVISIGNKANGKSSLMPPGDAEAALTVGGRLASKGFVDEHCAACCVGPGPDGGLKPDVSWFSPVTVAGGGKLMGSSFAAALTSSLAAHTFERLKDPTPDLVKALLISKTERSEHDPGVGWGTPFHDVAPWECAQGTVSMAWNAHLEPKFDYYWRDIPVPAEMLEAGIMSGGASLTAVLEPLTSPFAGENYFASRIEVTLQYLDASGNWSNLLGSMRESTIDETSARNDLKKWQPVRHHKRAKFAIGVSDDVTLRIRARLYTRDLWQPGLQAGGLLPPQRIAFVLNLSAPEGASDGIYDSMVRGLGNFVESAVIESNIELET